MSRAFAYSCGRYDLKNFCKSTNAHVHNREGIIFGRLAAGAGFRTFGRRKMLWGESALADFGLL